MEAAPSQAPAGLTVGERIGPYRVVGALGAGATADVHLVEHVDGGARYALKALRIGSTRRQRRFLREAELLARLSHPGIVRVHEVLTDGPLTALVLEYVDGPTLADLIRGYQPSLRQADALARQIISGVAAAHRGGLIHRDLKPANILLDVAGDRVVAKLSDFGLAKALDDDTEGPTHTGMTLGTPRYIAPEQFRSAKHADPRADLFSLGTVLYELLTGSPAFPGRDVIALYDMASAGRYRPLQELAPQLPERVERAIDAALRPDRAQRVGSAEALLDLWTGGDPAPDADAVWEPRHLQAISELRTTDVGPRADATESLGRPRTTPLAPARRPTVVRPPSQRPTLPASPPKLPSAPPAAPRADGPPPPSAPRRWGLPLVVLLGGIVGACSIALGLIAAAWWFLS